MWYKYLNRSADSLRIWRRGNLKYHQDDIGMTKKKFTSKTTDTLLRMSRTQGVLRGSNVFILTAAISCFFYWKKQIYDPSQKIVDKILKEQQDKQLNFQAKQKLFFNRYGAPTRPIRSIDQLMVFLASSESIDKAVDFISYNGTIEVYNDQEKGLDSWITKQDSRMLDYYKQAQKHNSH